MEEYRKTQWVSKETRVTADRMNNIEEGVEYSVSESINLKQGLIKIMEAITQLAGRTTNIEDAIKNVSGGTVDLTEINNKIKILEEGKAPLTHTHMETDVTGIDPKAFDDLIAATKKPVITEPEKQPSDAGKTEPGNTENA